MRDAFSFGYFDPNLAETPICLIPKGENPTYLKNFRPISRCNITDKVIIKILVNRLDPFLDELIGLLQCSFLFNRGTTNNHIIA